MIWTQGGVVTYIPLQVRGKTRVIAGIGQNRVGRALSEWSKLTMKVTPLLFGLN